MNKNSKDLSVLNALQLSSSYLEGKGIDSSRLNSELLLAKILNCRRIDLYLMFDRPLTKDETQTYREFIARRGKYEPLQYILGEVEFYNLKFIVNKNVLIPRPETEILIEETIKICNENNIKTILDVGTGSGNIPIALAKNLNGVEVTSIDFSKEAIKVAEENALINEVADKVQLLTSDIKTYQPGNKYDLVISNPPYVAKDDYSSLQKEIVDYEPIESVTDNSDGYEFYRLISERSSYLLEDGGYLLFEAAEGQSEIIQQILKKNSFVDIKVVSDYQNIERVIIGKKI